MHEKHSQVLCLVPLALPLFLAVGAAAPPRSPNRLRHRPRRQWTWATTTSSRTGPNRCLTTTCRTTDGLGGQALGVWAESPDKVWVGQRGEIELPPGAEPWTCACLLDPRRTNTGRRAYSGNDYDYDMRRHHIVFAVDREGYAIEEWLQHDEYLAPPRGSGLGEV